jgi:adenylyltransferase/sulfurtransferase
MAWVPREVERYARQIVLPGFGKAGQMRLAQSRALLVGVGGLGSPAAMYLAGAGIGTLGLVDDDKVDVVNLHRQIMHTEGARGMDKVKSARARIEALNPEVRVIEYCVRLDPENAAAIIGDYHVVVDGTDNFAARYALSDACLALGVPYVYGAVLGYQGQVTVLCTRSGPCYRCLYPEPPAPGTVPTCADAGILGTVPGVIGALQANETIKVLLGRPSSLEGCLLLYEADSLQFRAVGLRQNPDCAACARRTGSLDDHEIQDSSEVT